MKKSCFFLLCLRVFFLSFFVVGHTLAKTSIYMQELYRKVTNGLIDIRKQYPTIQPKVYAILDQVDKMLNTTKTISHKKRNLKKVIQEKDSENTLLKNQLSSLKNNISKARQSLEYAKIELQKKLDEEKVYVSKLFQERQELLKKVAKFEKKQQEQMIKKTLEREVNNKEIHPPRAKKLVSNESSRQSLSRTSISEPSSPR